MINNVLECIYDLDTKRTDIKISNKYGVFSASSQPAEEDKPYASQFIGGEIAERKATIKAYKSKLKELKIRYAEVQHIWYSTIDSNYCKMSNILNSRKVFLEKQIEDLEDYIKALEDSINTSVEDYVKKKKALLDKVKKES